VYGNLSDHSADPCAGSRGPTVCRGWDLPGNGTNGVGTNRREEKTVSFVHHEDTSGAFRTWVAGAGELEPRHRTRCCHAPLALPGFFQCRPPVGGSSSPGTPVPERGG